MDDIEHIKKLVKEEYTRFRLCGLTDKKEFKELFIQMHNMYDINTLNKCLNQI